MASYGVAVWLWWEDSLWPEVAEDGIEAETPFAALLEVLHAHRMVRAAKVVVNEVKSRWCYRYWGVECLDDEGFSYRAGGKFLLGVPETASITEEGKT